jgi:hypothetical protein
MAQFPSLVPSEAPITPGAWPATHHQSLNGSESSIRHGSAAVGGMWRPRFVNITYADFLDILDHYRGEHSQFDSFGFDPITLAADRTPAGFAWLYASQPQIVDQHVDVFDVQCEFRCEPRGLVVAPGRAWRTGATTFSPGARSGGIVYAAGANWVTSETTFTPGTRSDGVGSNAGVQWVTSSTTFTPGSRVGGSLVLLLPCDGTDGSTTFTDASSAARTVTANGNAQISTARSKWGSGSALFDGNGDYLSTTIGGGLGAGAFTLEFWFYRTASTGLMFNCRSTSPGSDGLDVFADGRVSTTNLWIFGDSAVTSIQSNAWTHFAVTRDSLNVMRRFFDGVQVGGDTTVANNFSHTAFQLGGSIGPNTGYMAGNLDDIRITINAALYTPGFTPPSGPFSPP